MSLKSRYGFDVVDEQEELRKKQQAEAARAEAERVKEEQEKRKAAQQHALREQSRQRLDQAKPKVLDIIRDYARAKGKQINIKEEHYAPDLAEWNILYLLWTLWILGGLWYSIKAFVVGEGSCFVEVNYYADEGYTSASRAVADGAKAIAEAIERETGIETRAWFEPPSPEPPRSYDPFLDHP